MRYRTESKNLVTQELVGAQWSVGYQGAMPAWRDLEGTGQVSCHLHEIRARAKKARFQTPMKVSVSSLRNFLKHSGTTEPKTDPEPQRREAEV